MHRKKNLWKVFLLGPVPGVQNRRNFCLSREFWVQSMSHSRDRLVIARAKWQDQPKLKVPLQLICESINRVFQCGKSSIAGCHADSWGLQLSRPNSPEMDEFA